MQNHATEPQGLRGGKWGWGHDTQNFISALTGVAQLAGHPLTKQKVTGSIPGHGTCLCCRFGPRLGRV